MEIVVSIRNPDVHRMEFLAEDLMVLQAARREEESRRLRHSGGTPHPMNSKWKALGESTPVTMDAPRAAVSQIQGLYASFSGNTSNAITSITGMIPAFVDTCETYRQRYDMGMQAGALATHIATQLKEIEITAPIDIEALSQPIEAYLAQVATSPDPSA